MNQTSRFPAGRQESIVRYDDVLNKSPHSPDSSQRGKTNGSGNTVADNTGGGLLNAT